MDTREVSVRHSACFIAIVIILLSLNGCAIIRPVAQLTGGVLKAAGRLAGTAAKGAVAAAPFFL
ncbi:hypothetical protein ACFL3N_01510 [Candidatus Omnitrophota bacterium]